MEPGCQPLPELCAPAFLKCRDSLVLRDERLIAQPRMFKILS